MARSFKGDQLVVFMCRFCGHQAGRESEGGKKKRKKKKIGVRTTTSGQDDRQTRPDDHRQITVLRQKRDRQTGHWLTSCVGLLTC